GATPVPSTFLGPDVVAGKCLPEPLHDQPLRHSIHLGHEVDPALEVDFLDLTEILLQERPCPAGDLDRDRQLPLPALHRDPPLVRSSLRYQSTTRPRSFCHPFSFGRSFMA